MWWLALLWACTDEEPGPVCPEWDCATSVCAVVCSSDDLDLRFDVSLDMAPVDYDGDCTCTPGTYIRSVRAHLGDLECGEVEGLVEERRRAPDPKYLYTMPEWFPVGEEVCIHASWSFEPTCDPPAVSWSPLWPKEPLIEITGADTLDPCFTFPEHGMWTLLLLVGGDIEYVTVATYPMPNNAPVADAGTSTAVVIGPEVCLNGRGSFDPDGDMIAYRWGHWSRPEEGTARLDTLVLPEPCYTPDALGEWAFSLKVTDGELVSPMDLVTIQVEPY